MSVDIETEEQEINLNPKQKKTIKKGLQQELKT